MPLPLAQAGHSRLSSHLVDSAHSNSCSHILGEYPNRSGEEFVPEPLGEELSHLLRLRLKEPRVIGRRYFGTKRHISNSGAGNKGENASTPKKLGRKVGRPRIKHTDQISQFKSHDNLQWNVIKPVVGKSQCQQDNISLSDTASDASDSLPKPRPRIWAHNRAELLDILPWLSKAIDGVAWEHSEIPFLLLEGPTSHDTRWINNKDFELSMVRDFSCYDFDLESPLMHIKSLEEYCNHTGESGTVFQSIFYAHDGSFLAPDIPNDEVNLSKSLPSNAFQNTTFNFLNAKGCYQDLSAMQLPTYGYESMIEPNPPKHTDTREFTLSSNAKTMATTSMTGCICNCAPFRIGCPIFGHSDSQAGSVNHNTYIPMSSGQWQAAMVDTSGGNGGSNTASSLALIEDTAGKQTDRPRLDLQIDSLLSRYYHQELDKKTSYTRMRLLADDETGGDNHPQPRGGTHHADYTQTDTTPLPISNSSVRSRIVDHRVPKAIPAEIQALINAHLSGLPVAVISSQEFPLRLPSEYGCNFLGFFFLTDINGEKDESFVPKIDVQDRAQGRIRWKLRFHWTPGGEDFLPGSEKLASPWWMRNEESVPEPSYMMREDLLQSCHSLLPLYMLANPGPSLSKGSFPTGWFCMDCGKLNKQTMLRHRICSSSACQMDHKNKKPSSSYAERLEIARDHVQSSPLAGPPSRVPESVAKSSTSWVDGMRTFYYLLNDLAYVKHVFTANIPSLQEEATLLFRDIQLQVELSRQIKGPGYFVHVVEHENSQGTDTIGWNNAPSCLKQARDLMTHIGQTYGETEVCTVHQLKTLAWVTSGRGKGPNLHAQTGVITILCLGADAALTLTHKLNVVKLEDCTSLPPESLTDTEMIVTSAIPEELEVEPDLKLEDMALDNSHVIGESNITTSDKKESNDVVITLVHGDVLVLAATDFECHIKRTGTTILLIGDSNPSKGVTVASG